MKQKNSYDSQAKLFKALMHPARLAILDVLRSTKACVCHLEAALGYRQAYISQQLMALRSDDLLDTRRVGSNIYYRVSKPEIFSILDAAQALLGKKNRPDWPTILRDCTCPHCAPKQ